MRKTICIILAAVMMIAMATSAFAGTITVSGTGEVLVPADTAIISLGVTARNKDVLTAQAEVNEAIAKVRAALTEEGIAEEDINTGYLNIYAVYDYSSDMEELAAYNVSSTLAVRTTDMEKVGSIIDTAFGSGANTLDGISFSVSDTGAAEEQALKEAVKAAQVKANILAAASGMEITGIGSINEGGTYSYDRGILNNFGMAEEKAMDAGSTYVQAAKLTVSANVTVTYTTAEDGK